MVNLLNKMTQIAQLTSLTQSQIFDWLTQPDNTKQNVDNLAKLDLFIKELSKTLSEAKEYNCISNDCEVYGDEYILVSKTGKDFTSNYNSTKVFDKLKKINQDIATEFVSEYVKVTKKDMDTLLKKYSIKPNLLSDCIDIIPCKPTKRITLKAIKDDTTNTIN